MTSVTGLEQHLERLLTVRRSVPLGLFKRRKLHSLAIFAVVALGFVRGDLSGKFDD